MIPITGPFVKTKGSRGSVWYSSHSGYKQKKPYNLSLPWEFEEGGFYKSVKPDGSPLYTNISLNLNFCQERYALNKAQALNKAYAQFNDKVSTTASLGVDLVQYGQARSSMVSRLHQLADFGRNLKSGNIIAAANALGTTLTPYQEKKLGKYRRTKSLSSQWLEWSFGWKPTVQGIYDSLETLEMDITMARLKGGGSVHDFGRVNPPFPFTNGVIWKGKTFAKLGASVSVENPNLHLAARLGILNPAMILFEVVPWSFLYGWVSNIDQWISSWTDLLGLNLVSPYHTSGCKLLIHDFWSDYEWFGDSYVVVAERVPAMYKPTFLHKPLRFGLQRAANAISLLIQQLPKK